VGTVAGNARGIDVSNFAGEFNWDGTSGLTFGICRASQGLGAAGTNSPDPFLTWNWPRIKARGLARGAYHFLDPRLDGAAQASYFVEQLNKVGLDTTDMLWLDNETPGASPAAVAACARDFMTRLSALRPHNPRGVYSFFSFITAGNCAGLRSYPLWLAIFQPAAPSAPAPWSAWRFWQSGAASSHDNDVFNGTPAELAAWIGSFQPQVEVEVQSGQLNTGASAVTVITVPHGSGSSSTVDSTKGQTVLPFPVPKGTGVISVKRLDAGEVIVGYEVS
jgi:lysozyme